MIKKLTSLLCVLVICVNLSYVVMQDPADPLNAEQAINNEWKQRREEYINKMTYMESHPQTLSTEQLEEVRHNTQYKNQIIDNIMKQSVQNVQTSNGFMSFLSINRSIQDQDDPSKFFPHSGITTWIHGIPSAARASITGWSGSYWPMRNGGISLRYNKNANNSIGDYDAAIGGFTSFYNWAMSVSRYDQPSDYLQFSSSPDFATHVDQNYSPAEKYDLLVGDTDFTLTNYEKNEGTQYAWGGDVVGWFGICHGWSPASYYFNRPLSSVLVTAANGMSIKFQPDDIKGLASRFMANAQYTTLFIGNRCEYYYPDPGWFSSSNCISLSPASFLITIGNQVGLFGKSLTFDPEADPEIWNFPIKDYEFRFYNPLTNDFFSNANGAKVSLDYMRGSTDSFNQFIGTSADPRAVSAVGIFMKVSYTNEHDITELRHDDTTAPDKFLDSEFDAIIELDQGDNIVGGEWKFKSHPNFIWNYDETMPIKGVSDEKLPYWSTGPDSLALIKEASALGQPLKAIVDMLVNSS